MKICYGDKELLSSENFLTFGGGETKIEIQHRGEALFFVLDMLVDESKKQRHELVVVDKQTLKLRLWNWENPLGTGFIKPIEAGTISNRKLFILLWIKKPGKQSESHEITFSAYIGEEVSNG
ncbi:hypothetical protein KKF70_06675 [bacterium]|nr:hypothetical protein [bacterium]